MDIENVPDLVEPIRAWRAWSLSPQPYLLAQPQPTDYLHSTNVPHVWTPRAQQPAECMNGGALARTGHEPPHERCTCGYYALRTLGDVVELFIRPSTHDPAGVFPHAVIGEVYLWGKVIAHELGYRAQYAYPKTIITARLEISERVARLYQCSMEESCTWENLCDNSGLSQFSRSSKPISNWPTLPITSLTASPPPVRQILASGSAI